MAGAYGRPLFGAGASVTDVLFDTRFAGTVDFESTLGAFATYSSFGNIARMGSNGASATTFVSDQNRTPLAAIVCSTNFMFG